MTEQPQIDYAKRRLAKRTYNGATRFCGIPLEHFNEEELRKIAEIAEEQIRHKVRGYKQAAKEFLANT